MQHYLLTKDQRQVKVMRYVFCQLGVSVGGFGDGCVESILQTARRISPMDGRLARNLSGLLP